MFIEAFELTLSEYESMTADVPNVAAFRMPPLWEARALNHLHPVALSGYVIAQNIDGVRYNKIADYDRLWEAKKRLRNITEMGHRDPARPYRLFTTEEYTAVTAR
jgi:hypothetical protein